MIFRRDLDLYLAAAYRKKFEETGNEKWRKKEENVLYKFDYQIRDPRADYELGEIYFEQEKFEKAATFFRWALVGDSMNSLKYYNGFISVYEKLGRPLPPYAAREKVLVLLEEYKKILLNNGHFTILTDNPQHAAELYEYFEMAEKADKIRQIWLEEVIKYTIKYGPPPKPLI